MQIWGLVGLLALCAFALAYQFVEPAPAQRLVMATGRADGAYHAFGLRYRERLAEDGIQLELRESAGALDNLQRLRNGEVDVAFAQGGTALSSEPENAAIRSLGSLYLEPLWIFVREDIRGARLDALAGRRVALGAAGSGSRAVAELLFADAGVEVDSLPLSGGEAIDALQRGEADAVSLVAGLNSPSVQRLLALEGVRPMSLQRAAAFTRRHRFLSRVSLPSGALSPSQNSPSEDLLLLAPAAALATRDDLHPALAGLLLLAARDIHASPGLLEAEAQFPSPALVDFPLTEEAERFYRRGPPLLQRYLPFWAAVLVDRLWVMLVPLLGLMLPLSRILPPVYRWRMRKRIYRWYDELQEMDLHAEREPQAADLESGLRRLDEIEREVRGIDVPLSYGQELYMLRQHLELLRSQLRRRLGEVPGDGADDDANGEAGSAPTQA